MRKPLVIVVLALVATLGLRGAVPQPGSPDFRGEINATPARIRSLLDDGRLAEAESLARVHLAECESIHVAESIEVAEALDLFVEARWVGSYADDDSLERARKAVAIKERHLPADDSRLVRSLNNLSHILFLRDEYGAARSIAERSLSIAEASLGPEHLEVAESLSALGDVLLWTNEYPAALHSYDRARAIREKQLGPEHPKVGQSLCAMSWVRRLQSDYEGARNDIERALAIQEKGLRADHPDLAQTLWGMAQVHLLMGERTEAIRLHERAVAIAERSLDPGSPRLAQHLFIFANFCKMQLEFNYTDAKRLIERAMAIQEMAYGRQSYWFAVSQGVLANVLGSLGDYNEAEPLIRDTVDVLERVLGPENDDVGAHLMQLGGLLVLKGDPAGAFPPLRRALSILEHAYGPDQRIVGEATILFGQAHHATGEYAEAERLYRKALAVFESQSPESDNTAWALLNLASVLGDMGRIDEAKPIYERGIVIRERIFGPEHPIVAWNLLQIAEALVQGGETRNGITKALRVDEIGRDHLRLMARALPERLALRYAGARYSALDLALSLVASGVERPLAGQTWDALIRSRALILDEMTARLHEGGGREHPETASRHAALAAARQRLADLAIRAPTQATSQNYQEVVDAARREKEVAEQALAEVSMAYREVREREKAGLAEIRSALPRLSALVAFVRYQEHEIPTSRSTADTRQEAEDHVRTGRASDRTTPAYAAFVLPADGGELFAVRIGAAAEIDSLVARWRKEIARGASGLQREMLERDYRAAGEALRRRIWDPLASQLGEARRVFVVRDGNLHLVNLGTLPVGRSQFLVETGPLIHYLSTERDLLPGLAEVPKGEGILALGGPEFEGTTKATIASRRRTEGNEGDPHGAAVVPVYRGPRSACGDFQSLRFEPLPGSEREVKEVAALWGKANAGKEHSADREKTSPKQRAVLRLTGPGASETAFKVQAPGRQVLHLATHGFFLGGKCPSALDATRPSGGPVAAEYQAPPPLAGENPLLLSGLALAGANGRASARPDEDDGVLTAEEVAALDLSGVDWVVLSACDTGVGAYLAGEGMFGLQRAFQMAGARSVIMSLWSVEDEATRIWMRNLYLERLGGASTAEAVRNASVKLIGSLKRSGLPAHPYFWGAFLAVGDWR